MPKVRKDTLRFQGKDRSHNFMEYEIHVNADGVFYARLPLEEFKDITPKFFSHTKVSGKFINCFDVSIDKVHDLALQAFKSLREPNIKEEIVIRYNIESNVSFAVDSNGDIHRHADEKPNGARWQTMSDKFGGHHSANPAKGGYSLTIGARVMKKVTYTYNGKDTVIYEYYQGDEREANQLNKWCSFSLPDECQEMPYTAKSALFFDNLMMGMARVNKQIQELTSTEERLLQLINSDVKLLGN